MAFIFTTGVLLQSLRTTAEACDWPIPASQAQLGQKSGAENHANILTQLLLVLPCSTTTGGRECSRG